MKIFRQYQCVAQRSFFTTGIRDKLCCYPGQGTTSHTTNESEQEQEKALPAIV